MSIKFVVICVCILILSSPVSEGRRGRGRGRTKSRVQIGLPITGKYRDPESDQYYNNNNVSKIKWSFKLKYFQFKIIQFQDIVKNFKLKIKGKKISSKILYLSDLSVLNFILFPLKGAKILQASHFDYEYVLGHKIAFLCVAKGNPRPQITWYKDGTEIFQHLYMHVSILTSLLIYS